MSGQTLNKEDYARFSRMLFLLLNRAMMYKADHPNIKDAIGNLQQELASLDPDFSSLTLILNRDQLFLDEEPVDSRINVGRIVALFKKIRVQSVSFLAGVTTDELQVFIDLFTSPQKFPDCNKMIEELNFRGVQNLKINHVFYKKMTKDDEVVARRDKREKPSSFSGQADPELSRQFMKTIVESILAEETENTLSMKNLLADPAGLSESMLTAENRSMQAVADGKFPVKDAEGGAGTPGGEDIKGLTSGATLLYQIQALSDDVSQKIEAGDTVDMMDVADAVFEMKRQLTLGIEAQKAINQAFANEEQILGQMNALTDNVIIKLIKNEYQQGKITTARLAQILRRLVPEPGELKRLLPKIKAALLAEGMPIAEYLQLVRQLGKELESEGLARVLQEAAESVGVDGDELVTEILKKPERAAELIAIAAEIRKGSGDENAFTEALVNYVEQLGVSMKGEMTGPEGSAGDTQARQVMADVGSGLMAQLKNMNLSTRALAGVEERINARIESVFEKLSAEQVPLFSTAGEPSRPEKTLLQMMEQSLGENEELKNFLKNIRSQAEAGELDENNFGQIYAGLREQENLLRKRESERNIPPGVLRQEVLRFHLEKELFRAKRHNIQFSTLSFTIVTALAQDQLPEGVKIRRTDLVDAIFQRLVDNIRASDIIGELDKAAITVILPMADKAKADLALKRISKLLSERPFEVRGAPVNLIVAGAVSSFEIDMKPNVDTYVKMLSYELDNVASRIKYVHRLK